MERRPKLKNFGLRYLLAEVFIFNAFFNYYINYYLLSTI
jgi:hypothetical protein